MFLYICWLNLRAALQLSNFQAHIQRNEIPKTTSNYTRTDEVFCVRSFLSTKHKNGKEEAIFLMPVITVNLFIKCETHTRTWKFRYTFENCPKERRNWLGLAFVLAAVFLLLLLQINRLMRAIDLFHFSFVFVVAFSQFHFILFYCLTTSPNVRQQIVEESFSLEKLLRRKRY